jgi:hypothetical protein
MGGATVLCGDGFFGVSDKSRIANIAISRCFGVLICRLIVHFHTNALLAVKFFIKIGGWSAA